MTATETQHGTGLRVERPPALPVSIGGRYRVERLLGSGGCGVVYAGRHDTLGKPVAIKVLRPEIARDPAQAQRFAREARLAATLHHENIVDITDFGVDPAGGAPFLVMELLRGHTLMAVMRETGVLPWQRVVGVLVQLARAVACAHGRGVLHRDIKPHNIVLVEHSGRVDHVKLCDFGLSRLRNGDDRITSTGAFVGTPAYMAPEQITGGEQDERCDLYALGVTGFEMLSGRLPYQATSPVALVAEILAQRRVALAPLVAADVPPALVELIERCIACDPAARPGSAHDIERELLGLTGPAMPPLADLTGEMIGSYRVLSLLGQGGSGAVWLAEHPVIGTKVAIKVLYPESLVSGAAERFVNEARAASTIQSSHIARYLDLGRLPSGQPYAILEYLDGETLFDRLARTVRLSVSDAVALARQIAGALAAAHAAGIVHRDIKPANIFLARTDGGVTAKVLDFGIAKLHGPQAGGAPQTVAGYFMGTVDYCPPEQVLGGAIGPAADTYALGATLYEMLVGSAPFTGDPTEIASAKTVHDAPRVTDTRADVPAHLATLVADMLARSPAARPTMAGVIERLVGNAPPMVRALVVRPPSQPPAPARVAWPDDEDDTARRDTIARRVAPWIAAAAVAVAAIAWALWPMPRAVHAVAPAPATVVAPGAKTAPATSAAAASPAPAPAAAPAHVRIEAIDPPPGASSGAPSNPPSTSPPISAPASAPVPVVVASPPRAQPASRPHPSPAAHPAPHPTHADAPHERVKSDVLIADPFGSP